MPAPSDLIHQTSTTTGTGDLTLSSVNGKRSFNTAFGTGGTDTFDYYVSNQDAAEWERGTGHLSDATTLVRDTVIASSNSDAAVDFSAGIKDVTNDIPAANQLRNEGSTVTDGHMAVFSGTTGRLITSSGGIRLLNSGTVSDAATLDIVLTSYTAYRGLKFVLNSFVPADDDVELWMRLSTNGGVSYDAGASDYRYSSFSMLETTDASHGTTGAAQLRIAGVSASTSSISNVASEGGVSAVIDLLGHTDTATRPRVLSRSGFLTASGASGQTLMVGHRVTAQDTDAVRFLFESDNIASGSWALYGYH